MAVFVFTLDINPDAEGSTTAALEKAMLAMQDGIDKAGLDGIIELTTSQEIIDQIYHAITGRRLTC